MTYASSFFHLQLGHQHKVIEHDKDLLPGPARICMHSIEPAFIRVSRVHPAAYLQCFLIRVIGDSLKGV